MEVIAHFLYIETRLEKKLARRRWAIVLLWPCLEFLVREMSFVQVATEQIRRVED